MVEFSVTKAKNRLLQEEMTSLNILEKDIVEKFVRSSGSGGQKTNKTSSAVHLIHTPTGIEAKCSRERSQSINRFLARRDLVEKMKAHLGLTTKEDIEREKIRKQKAKRKKRHQQKS